ncbi:hypothetical protein JCM10213v2_000925 [Rhodosporidiobolus nylandii]
MPSLSCNANYSSLSSPWRSDTNRGYYQAYNNASDAMVTFTFIGVGVQYVATKQPDRGICLLAVDYDTAVTIDLFTVSEDNQTQQVIYTSPTLEYGKHTVSISQAGPDARFGYYPYLASETWIQIVPSEVAAYTRTQATSSHTSSSSSSDSGASGTKTPAIAGGVVGAVVACALAGFLLYLWRREKKKQRRKGGLALVEKETKTEGKSALEDQQDASSAGHDPFAGPGEGVPAYAAYGAHPPGPYGNPYGAYPGYGYAPPSAYSSPAAPHPASVWGYPYSAHPHLAPPPSGRSTDSAASTGGAQYATPSGPSPSPAELASRSAHHSGASDTTHRTYPHHVQGNAHYAVPEI